MKLIRIIRDRLVALGGAVRSLASALGARLRGRRRGKRGRRRDRQARRERPPSALSTFGTRIGRHAGIYGAGSGGALALNLVTLAVLTRFLPPTEFGQYTLLLIFSMLLSMLYNLGSLRGSMRWVFGASGDDEDDDDEDEPEGEQAPTDEKRKALGTALVLTALIASLGTLLVGALAPPLAEFLVEDDGEGRLALIAGASGGIGAVWQLASTVPRRERRPKTSVFLQLSRPVLVLAATIPLVAASPDVDNAVVGLAAGTAAAALLALAVTRKSYVPAFSATHAERIFRLGVPWIPLLVSVWVILNAGVFILAEYAPESDVGLFRVAMGVAALASLPVSAFMTAWGPLRREPIYGAVKAERGKVAVGGVLATYFALATIGLLLGFLIGADLLVRIAPPAYSEAAPLIPLVGLGFAFRGSFRVLFRTSKFPRKRRAWISLAVVSAIVFVAAAFALIPPLGTYGAALAIVAGFFTGGLGMLYLSQRGPSPVPIGWGRLGLGLAIAAGCYASGRALGALAGSRAPAVEAAAFVAYPVLLVVTGIVPRDHLGPLRRMAAAALPGPAPGLNGRVELDRLAEPERALLEVLIRHRQPVGEVAPLVRVSPEVLTYSFVAALRRAGGLGQPSERDARIGLYLLSSAPVAERDQIWRRIRSEGVDPLETDALSLTLERLRRAPPEAWRVR